MSVTKRATRKAGVPSGCAKMSKVSELTPSHDWSVFAPFERRIVDLLSDGTFRSVREVRDAIGAKSNCYVRDVLNDLADKGTLEKAIDKRDRHHVDCYRLAAPRGLRPVPKALPAKRR